MIDTQLILVEGMPSTGKTTNARMLNIQLERNHLASEWVHEVAMPQPVLFFDEVGLTRDEYREYVTRFPETEDILRQVAVFRKNTVEINQDKLQWYYAGQVSEEAYQALLEYDAWKFPVDRYKTFALEKWSSFVEKALSNKEKVYIIDSAIFQFQIFTFLFENRPFSELRDFVGQIVEILKPLRPTLLYLYRDDAQATIDYLERDRGTEYLSYLYERDKDRLYYRDKPTGAEGFKHFLREYNDCDNMLFEAFPGKKLSLEISSGEWHSLENQMLSFFELMRQPDVEAKPPKGVFRNEELGFTITIDGCHMVDPTGKERKLITKSEKEFYVDWLPVCLRFENDVLVIAGTPICERWTVTGTQYKRVVSI